MYRRETKYGKFCIPVVKIPVQKNRYSAGICSAEWRRTNSRDIEMGNQTRM